MPNNTQTVQEYPSGAIFVTDPATRNELDMQPFLKLLYERYRGDKDYLVEALEELSHYLIHEETECDSARKLRRILGIVNSLTTAIDSITTRKAHRA
ncbi:hypothetical protein [Hymenobacter psychrotolerans]|uniref:Uncharacterized protein n=1 Tax=Hymenobacter psychrotolerans DSM 18569 TaxID=1121959 RepID=A0A1M6Z6Y7_9BACT|nr:hypothetical protein [Hymenobacter psychrotolerans]SHL26170.1 hypothetical protein SAMN02746009_02440 [Hymenobacter psychrotolerans DSM 18569]